MSNIGKALDKIVNPETSGRMVDTRIDNTSRQRRFEYEDGIITRSIEAASQIQRMAQPYVFSKSQLDKRHFLLQGDSNSEAMVMLRDLRNRVTLKNATLGATILVTSAAPDPEAGIVSRNLAAIMAADENRTSLLVECKSEDDRLYGDDIESPQGLMGYVSNDEVSVHDILLPTGIPRMRVIPFGGDHVMNFEYLRSTRMRILIKDITRRYPRERFTVIDAPAVNEVPDVELLNEYADYILLTVPYGKVTDAQVKQSVAKLESSKVLGVIVTGGPKAPGVLGSLSK